MFKTNVSERNSHKFEVIYYRGFISLKVRKPLHVANSFSINFTSIRPLNFALCATKLYLAVIRKQANLSRECSRFDLKLMHTHREKERNGEETRACTIRARVYFIFARAGARQYFLYHIKKKKRKVDRWMIRIFGTAQDEREIITILHKNNCNTRCSRVNNGCCLRAWLVAILMSV